MKIGQIEKGVPIPKDKRHKYPFEEMEVGDSFCIQFPNSEKTKTRKLLATAKWRAQNRLGRKFVTRLVGDNEFRVWRTK